MPFSQESSNQEGTQTLEQAIDILGRIQPGEGFRLWLKIDDKFPSVKGGEEISFQTQQEKNHLFQLIAVAKRANRKIELKVEKTDLTESHT